MKYTCPECKTTGEIPEDGTVAPTTQTTCYNCGAKLNIEQETGRVKAQTGARHGLAATDRLAGLGSWSLLADTAEGYAGQLRHLRFEGGEILGVELV